MDSQDPLRISADNEIHKKQRKRTKKIIGQLQEQVGNTCFTEQKQAIRDEALSLPRGMQKEFLFSTSIHFQVK